MVIGLGILIAGVGWAVEFEKDGPSVNEHFPSKVADKSFAVNEPEMEILTDPQVSLEFAGVQGDDYRFKAGRQVQFDILRLEDLFVHFAIQEKSLFDYSPSQLDHSIEYFGIGYKTTNGRIKLFWDHTCNNASRQLAENQRNDIHWNEIGIGYETTGMRLGHKNNGINFDTASMWLNRINWRASLSKVWMRTDNDYDYILKLGFRDDVLRVNNNVFYLQCDLNSIYDDRSLSYNPAVEIGDRIRIGRKACLSPFLSYEHFHDWYALGKGEDIFLAGIRLEMELGARNSKAFTGHVGSLEKEMSRVTSEFSEEEFPRFIMQGGYNVNVRGEKKKCRSSDLNVDVDILRLDHNKILTLNTYAGLLTDPGAFDIQNLNYRIGPSLGIELEALDLKLFHSYSCLYGVEHNERIKDYNLLGIEIGKADQLTWSLQGSVYASTHNFDYSGDLLTGAGYDFYKNEAITPYIHGAVHALLGSDAQFGQSLETGLKIEGKEGSFSVYLRWQNDFDIFRFGEGRQMWFGFKVAL